ncbi:MAG: nitrous oxide reductase accessory protein NosL [Syntrophobacteraceae bacterium]
MNRFVVILLVVAILTGSALAGERQPIPLTPTDRCPVCGMYVAKYKDFIAQIVFKDGSYVVFDGAKDMFKYYLNIAKYEQKKQSSDIDSIYVTDYYNATLIDSLKAYFVKGSNVYGPMGKELIPFNSEEDAREFMIDHSGDSMLKFDDVTMEILKPLD